MRRLQPPQRIAVITCLVPRTLLYLPVVAFTTGTASWYLASWKHFLTSSSPLRLRVIVARVITSLLAIQGLGDSCPTASASTWSCDVHGRIRAAFGTSIAINLILTAAEREGVSLVIMTTHGRGGLPRFILGSTTERLVHYGAPVLIVHPHPGAADLADAAAAVEQSVHR
jgi:hypothetical protein